MFAPKLFGLLVRKHPEANDAGDDRAVLATVICRPGFLRMATGQYMRKLLLSTLSHLQSLVVCWARTALHSSIQENEGRFASTLVDRIFPPQNERRMRKPHASLKNSFRHSLDETSEGG